MGAVESTTNADPRGREGQIEGNNLRDKDVSCDNSVGESSLVFLLTASLYFPHYEY
jgi:hypothetical protein